MKLQPIIRSLLETDLYKFSMGQDIYHRHPTDKTTWTFKCRNKKEDVFFTPEMVEEIKEQIQAYCNLKFTEDELKYLSSIPWLEDFYTDFLKLWHPDYNDFKISTDAECGLAIETTGNWVNTSMYEIASLAIVSEVLNRMKYDYEKIKEDFRKRLHAKVDALKTVMSIGTFSEFGLRRRASAELEEEAIRTLVEENPNFIDSNFIGTSNVYLAKKYNIKPVGTMAHEWIMAVGQGNPKHNPAYSNHYALNEWVDEYGVQNGIALTDTITTDIFLMDFDIRLATLFSGVRHDSGDPVEWGYKMIEHYKKLGIDPTTKTLLFSDSLNFEKAATLYKEFKGKAKVAFGIGTFIANDTFATPLNIVMKITKVQGKDVAKISDTPGKGMCKNQAYVDYLQRTLDWRKRDIA